MPLTEPVIQILNESMDKKYKNAAQADANFGKTAWISLLNIQSPCV